MQQRLIFTLCILLLPEISFAATNITLPPATNSSPAATQAAAPVAAQTAAPVAAQAATPVVAPAAAPVATQAAAPIAAQTATPVVAQTAAPVNAQNKAAVPVKQNPASASTVLKTEKDKISYAIGVDMGTTLRAQSIDVNPEILALGLKDGINNGQILLTPQEIGTTLANLQKQIITKREADFKALAEQNKRAGETFLQANKTKPGVVSLPSGLEYKIITPGTGALPTDKDNVTVHYAGNLPNGQEFDSSYKRGKPAQFPVAEVIPGWSEALRLMKVGATWEIYVPSNLAYGERGLPNGPIGPNQTLVFKINLISVEKKK